jgi:hypothetical protein
VPRAYLALLVALTATACLPDFMDDRCSGCPPCPTPVGTITVTDASSGGAVAGVSVAGPGAVLVDCSVQASATVCHVFFQWTGSFELTVSAPGYASRTVQLTSAGGGTPPCCDGTCPSYGSASVELPPI